MSGFGAGTGFGSGGGFGTGNGTGAQTAFGSGGGFGTGNGTGAQTAFGSGAGTGFKTGTGAQTAFGSGAGTGFGTGTGSGFTAPTAAPPTANPTAAPPTANPTAAPPTANPTAAPPTANPPAAPPTANPAAAPPTANPKPSNFRMKKYHDLLESKKLRKREGGASGGPAPAAGVGTGKGLTGGSTISTGFGASQQKSSLSGASSSLVYSDIPQQVSELVHPVSYDNRTAALFFTPREWRNPGPEDDPFFEWTRNDALRQRKQKLKPDYASLFEAKSQTIRGENVSERMDPASQDKPIIKMNERLLNLLKIENRQRIVIENDEDIVFIGSYEDRPLPFSYFARPGYGSILFDRLNYFKYFLSRMLFDVEAKIFVPEDGKATFAKLVTEREDKEVTRDEFIRMLSQEVKGPIAKEKAANLFDVIDVSGDGAVQREEFTAFFDKCLEIVREAREETPDERRLEELLFDYLRLFFNACSVKKKGYLTHEEFDKLVEMSEFEISWPSEVGTDSITYDDLTNHIRSCKRAWLQGLYNEKIVIERGYVHVNHDTAGDPFNKEAIVTMYLEGDNSDLTDRVQRFFEKHREAEKIHWGEDPRGRNENQSRRFILVFRVPNFDNGPYGLY